MPYLFTCQNHRTTHSENFHYFRQTVCDRYNSYRTHSSGLILLERWRGKKGEALTGEGWRQTQTQDFYQSFGLVAFFLTVYATFYQPKDGTLLVWEKLNCVAKVN